MYRKFAGILCDCSIICRGRMTIRQSWFEPFFFRHGGLHRRKNCCLKPLSINLLYYVNVYIHHIYIYIYTYTDFMSKHVQQNLFKVDQPVALQHFFRFFGSTKFLHRKHPHSSRFQLDKIPQVNKNIATKGVITKRYKKQLMLFVEIYLSWQKCSS